MPLKVRPTGLFDDDEPASGPAPAAGPPAVRLPSLQPPAATPAAAPDGAPGEVPWLAAGLIVRCLNQSLSAGRYAARIGVVQRVVEGGWGAELRMVDSQDVIVVDQEECGTTVPKPGAGARVVAGPYAGQRATFAGLSPGGRDAEVELAAGRQVCLPLAHICSSVA